MKTVDGAAVEPLDDETLKSFEEEAMKTIDDEGKENKQERLNLVQECPGAAIIVVVLTPNDDIICANAGDCRAVLCQNGVPVALSNDHKPFHAEEYARIERAGGNVTNGRVCGNLALSRALGDFKYKDRQDLSAEEQKVTCNPEIINVKNDPLNEFMVVACDGIYFNRNLGRDVVERNR